MSAGLGPSSGSPATAACRPSSTSCLPSAPPPWVALTLLFTNSVVFGVFAAEGRSAMESSAWPAGSACCAAVS
uniref:Uncharacterized protein n=1 Tax=Phenylobacterium glaciei TaxID=2803784 RepID=A0A974P5C2_9CAUL|nr:hypothetical protein JKL49_04585 [Phenylobacterium glaciei]